MRNVIQIDDRISVATSAPNAEMISNIADEGFKSLVNMRTEDEKQELKPDEERRHAENAGLVYLHYPVASDKLTESLVDGFRQKVEMLPAPVLVHCASGKRSGAMVMMHLGVEQGMSGDEVIDKAESMGFECDTPELKRFVRDYVDRGNGR